MFPRNVAVYTPTRLCSIETSLSTIRHDYVLSKRRCLPSDTTMFYRNVAVYHPTRLCSFETSLSTSNTTLRVRLRGAGFPYPVFLSVNTNHSQNISDKIARHYYSSIVCCVQFSVQSVKIVAPICLSSVSFLSTKHLKNQIFMEFCIDEFYENLLKQLNNPCF